MHKLAPNGVKECRNRSANLINRKRTNFCIEPTPPKNSHRKKNSRKKSIRKKIFLKSTISEIYFEIYEKLRIFQILKIIFKYIGNLRKCYHFLKKIITFSKSWNFHNFPISLKKKSHFFKNHAKSSKNFRNFEISQKLRIFQILEINFLIYRKFPKKITGYNFKANFVLFRFTGDSGLLFNVMFAVLFRNSPRTWKLLIYTKCLTGSG